MHSSALPLWKKIQRDNFTSLHKLSDFLELDADKRSLLIEKPHFPLNLPRRLAQKIKKNCLQDPLFKQFVPLKEELEQPQGFSKDPVGDTQAALTQKYLKKYEGRALLLTTGACAMHCRFCFRQQYSYSSQKDFTAELEKIGQDKTLREIILSGGDPLSLSNQNLKDLIAALEQFPHLKRLRFHTRFPIGIPERIDDSFIDILSNCSLQIWFVIHCNHLQELDSDIFTALKRIQCLGIPVLNQWVLLKGVNDQLETLQQLCEELIDHGIFPYYLHQLDRVEGAAHFEVDRAQGQHLIQALSHRLSGYAIPKYVEEIPGHLAKKPLFEVN